MKVLKVILILILGIILGIGGVAGAGYVIYSSIELGGVVDTVGLGDSGIVGEDARKMTLQNFISKLIDSNTTVGDYSSLVPVIGDKLTELINSETVKEYVNIDETMLKSLTLSELSNKFNLDSGLITITASLSSVGITFSGMEKYSALDDAYHKSNVMESIFKVVESADDYAYIESESLFKHNLDTNDIVLADAFTTETNVVFYQLTPSYKKATGVVTYGYSQADNTYVPIVDFKEQLALLTAGESIGETIYDGYYQVSYLIDANYDGILTQAEFDNVKYLELGEYERCYTAHGGQTLPQFLGEGGVFSINTETGVITCNVLNKQYFVYREGVYYMPISTAFDLFGTRYTEMYVSEMFENIENTQLRAFKDFTLQEFADGAKFDEAIGNSYLSDFIKDSVVNDSKMLLALCYSDGTTGGDRVLVKDLMNRINSLTIGDLVEINADTPYFIQSILDYNLTEIANIELAIEDVFDMESSSTSNLLKSLRYEKLEKSNAYVLPTGAYIGYEEEIGYVYSSTNAKLMKFANTSEGVMVYDISASIPDSTSPYLAIAELDSYNNAIYYKAQIVENGAEYALEKTKTLVENLSNQMGYLLIGDVLESEPTNEILLALVKTGATINNLEEKVNDLTFNDVYGTDNVWVNVEYGNINTAKPTYLKNEDGSFSLISDNVGLNSYTVSSSYEGNSNLYQFSSNCGMWLFMMYKADSTLGFSSYGDANKYVSIENKISEMSNTMEILTESFNNATYQQLYSIAMVSSAPKTQEIACKTFKALLAEINA